jgi:hypothetical protein
VGHAGALPMRPQCSGGSMDLIHRSALEEEFCELRLYGVLGSSDAGQVGF